ncbi:pentapeptide repeat-containing protein [Flavobacterium lindanitolerans]|nr:pentapeptide repeat-containing protein [Flavobacterium lindanitolerans]
MTDKTISNVEFNNDCYFEECIFSSVTFENCIFNLSKFKTSSFQNCNFYDCTLIIQSSDIEYHDFIIYASYSNNTFLNDIADHFSQDYSIGDSDKKLEEEEVLRHFFQIDGVKPRARKFSYIKSH